MASDSGEEKTAEEGTMTMDERKAKMEQLRAKMVRGPGLHYTSHPSPTLPQRSTTKANRASLIEESAKAKMTARENARLERQRKLAEVLRMQTEAEDRGEDVERQKNWEWTIEENDNWEKKKARKARRADYEFHGRGSCYSLHDDTHHSCVDDVHAARRRYKKDLDLIKPDLATYNRQKEAVLGLAPGSLSKSGSSTPSSSALTTFDPSGGEVSAVEPSIVLYFL